MNPNVKYELHQYEQLIQSIARGMGTVKGSAAKEATLQREINAEAERIKQTFIHEIFSLGDERHLERYIQYHQQALIRLMDETMRLSTTTTSKKKYYLICFHALEELLAFIEKHFTKYFDQDAKAPEAYLTITKEDLQGHLVSLYEALLAKSGNSKVAEVMVYAIRKIVEDDFKPNTTYRKVMYAKTLQMELTAMLGNSKQSTDLEEDLRNLTFYLNYNSMKSFTYHTHYIDMLLGQTESRAEMIEKLSYILKKINQVQVKPGIGYNTKAPTLKSQLTDYIVEEIEHLQRIQQLSLSAGQQPADGLLPPIKIQLELSVAQIAYLVKVFMEANIVVNRNVTELLKLLSQCIMSKKSETISFDSLRAKYYNVEHSTQVAAKKILLKVIGVVDRG